MKWVVEIIIYCWIRSWRALDFARRVRVIVVVDGKQPAPDSAVDAVCHQVAVRFDVILGERHPGGLALALADWYAYGMLMNDLFAGQNTAGFQ